MMIILDGVTPSNEGRGYILRRLLRRIVRSARLLGAEGKVLEVFMNTIMDTMTPSFPEIADNRERILRVAVAEERAFLKTLASGTSRFDEAASALRESGGFALAVDEDEIFDARDRVAHADGLLLCPEGAATARAWEIAVERGLVDRGERAMLFNCATGLKYPLPPGGRAIDRHAPIDYGALAAG